MYADYKTQKCRVWLCGHFRAYLFLGIALSHENKALAKNKLVYISCLHLPTFRSLAAILSEKSNVSLFPIEKPKLPNLTLP